MQKIEQSEPSIKRSILIDRGLYDDEKRALPIAISSEMPVDGEILSHKPQHIDLSRADDNGLPLLFNHDSNMPIGRVNDVRIDDDNVLRGNATFSNTPKAQEVLQMIDDGTLRDASVGARRSLTDYEINDDDNTIVYKDWQPLEVSIVSIPADASVGIARKDEIETQTKPEVKQMTDQTEVASIDRQAYIEQGRTAEIQRRNDIDAVFDDHLDIVGVNTLRKQAIKDGWTTAQAATELNKVLRAQLTTSQIIDEAKPAASDVKRETHVESGQDAIDKLRAGMEQAILVRSGQADAETKAAAAQNEFKSYSLVDFCRKSLELRGTNVNGLDKNQMVKVALQRDGGGLTTSDMAAVVENIANKQMMTGYQMNAGSWRNFCRIGSLTDFRSTSRVNLGGMGVLNEVAEDGSYERSYLSDYKETMQAKTYGREIMVTRKLIVNDDVNALVELPLRFGQKANQKVASFVIDLITSNPTLNADSTAVFASGHANLGTGGAISVTTLGEARKLMRLQKEQESVTGADDGDFISVNPRFLLVPAALETTAQVMVNSELDPTKTVEIAGTNAINPFYNNLTVLADPRLDANSATAYYLFADPQEAPTIEVGFLNGNDAPFIDQIDDFHTDGISYKVRIDFDATWLDYRGAVKNAGA